MKGRMRRLSAVMETFMPRRAACFMLASSLVVSHANALTLTEGSAWLDLTIPVCFEQPKAEHRQERAQIRKSVEQSWAKESAVSFDGWGACREESAGIRIRLSDGYPQTIGRGRHLDGVEGSMELPKLWGLASLSINAKSTVHEFGHALGFGHEYARADAPYEDACAITDKDGERYLEDDRALTAFDFDSIMVGCVKDATRAFSVGVPKLSAGDIYGLVRTYGSAPKNVLDADEAGDRFGHSIAVGDFDGDAIPDLAVGAPGERLEARSVPDGAVYLYKGDPIRGLRPWGRLTGNDRRGFGTGLAAEHLDGDKRMDLVVQAEDGTITAFKGRSRKPPKRWEDAPPILIATPIAAEAVVQQVEPFDLEAGSTEIEFGQASILADLDADGHDDLIVTAPQAPIDDIPSGQVFVYRSPDIDRPWKNRPPTFTPWYRFGQSY